MKRKRSPFLIIGVIMVIIAICFVVFTLNNPQVSFPWSNTITYIIYFIYIIATIYLIIKGFQKE
jgi:ABC-type transport system involved in cytochrome c biogenesis permease subunit